MNAVILNTRIQTNIFIKTFYQASLKIELKHGYIFNSKILFNQWNAFLHLLVDVVILSLTLNVFIIFKTNFYNTCLELNL